MPPQSLPAYLEAPAPCRAAIKTNTKLKPVKGHSEFPVPFPECGSADAFQGEREPSQSAEIMTCTCSLTLPELVTKHAGVENSRDLTRRHAGQSHAFIYGYTEPGGQPRTGTPAPRDTSRGTHGKRSRVCIFVP